MEVPLLNKSNKFDQTFDTTSTRKNSMTKTLRFAQDDLGQLTAFPMNDKSKNINIFGTTASVATFSQKSIKVENSDKDKKSQ